MDYLLSALYYFFDEIKFSVQILNLILLLLPMKIHFVNHSEREVIIGRSNVALYNRLSCHSNILDLAIRKTEFYSLFTSLT